MLIDCQNRIAFEEGVAAVRVVKAAIANLEKHWANALIGPIIQSSFGDRVNL